MIENVKEFFELKATTETKMNEFLESVGLDKKFTDTLITECETDFKAHLEGKYLPTRGKLLSATEAWQLIVTDKLYKLGKKIKSLVAKAELQSYHNGRQVWDSEKKGTKRGKN